MTDPKQITDPTELVGKTIARTHWLDTGADVGAFVFTDGSYVMLTADLCGNDDAELSIDPRAQSPWTLEMLGFISADERDRRIQAEMGASRAASEAHERARLVELLAKYPDVAKGGAS